jgi:Tol biopolymer transport system component
MTLARTKTLHTAVILALASTFSACGAQSMPDGKSAGADGGLVADPTQQAGPTDCVAQLPAAVRDRWIAYDSDREDFRRQIYMMHPDQSGFTRLLNDSSIDKEPAFSPDGASIAFTSDREGVPQVFLLQLATNTVTRVTNRSEGADQPSFSRDGTLIAFHSGESVYVVSTDGAQEHLVATGLGTFNAYFWPQFSADGSELVFDRNNEIDAVKLDGTGLRMIVQNWTTTIKAPAVSPNGLDVAYHVYCDDPGTSIWTTPFSTTTDPCKGRRVTPVGKYGAERSAWVTSTLISYEQVNLDTNVASIAVISRETGSTPCIITPGTADSRNPTWSQ